MKEPRDHLSRDLAALRYLDALNAGDLEAVAALWDEASWDPELEQMLADVDGALFVEGVRTNGKAEAEPGRDLRAKHPTAGFPTRQPRWVVVAGMIAALAAACILAVFIWQSSVGKDPLPETNPSAIRETPQRPEDSNRLSAWRQARLPEGTEPPRFTWPLPETSPLRASTSIPPDLLD